MVANPISRRPFLQTKCSFPQSPVPDANTRDGRIDRLIAVQLPLDQSLSLAGPRGTPLALPPPTPTGAAMGAILYGLKLAWRAHWLYCCATVLAALLR